MSPPVAQQIISSMKIIMGEDGTDEGGLEFIYIFFLLKVFLYSKLIPFRPKTTTDIVRKQQVSFSLSLQKKTGKIFDENKRISELFHFRYFRESLKKAGFIVYGHADSVIVPVLIFLPGKIRCVGLLL